MAFQSGFNKLSQGNIPLISLNQQTCFTIELHLTPKNRAKRMLLGAKFLLFASVQPYSKHFPKRTCSHLSYNKFTKRLQIKFVVNYVRGKLFLPALMGAQEKLFSHIVFDKQILTVFWTFSILGLRKAQEKVKR